LAATLAALAYLLFVPTARPAPSTEFESAASAVRVVGPGVVRVEPDTPLGRSLQVVTVRQTRVTAPVLTVTGTVVASLRPGNTTKAPPGLLAVAGVPAPVGRGSDYWQFNSPEVLTAFTDWQKSKADVAFAGTQLVAIRQLADARLDAQHKLVERFVKLVAAGTDTEKDLAAARADLKQAEITGRKDVHEAETAVRVAQRNEAALARQLQQAGLDPALLTSVTSDVDIVMADVPESYLDRVKAGQGCEARFFGLPGQAFAGQVKSIAPVISKERRSLRVLFTVTDLNDQLRPGMFAEIGLGTDPRDTLLAPADGVVHVGRADYMLVGAESPDTWRATEVRVGDLRGAEFEVVTGLKPGDRVLGRGAILLKPLVVTAVRAAGAPVNGERGGGAR
jgi:hypothetical protein